MHSNLIISIFSILLFFFSTNFCLWSRSSQTIPRPGRVNRFLFFFFLRNNLSFCDVFRVLGFSMFKFFFLFPSVKQVSKCSICKREKHRAQIHICFFSLIWFAHQQFMNEPKMSLLRTHLRRWEHQQGWRTSEQPPWPGGPGAQQQPHPPAKAFNLWNQFICCTSH